MSSIRRVQTERLLQDVVRSLYSTGINPTFSEVASRVSQYLSRYPAGQPLPLPTQDALAEGVSNPDEYNRLLSHLAINIDVLYESSLRQVEDVLLLTSSLQSDLSRLKSYRRRIETRIDDYLLSQYNTDGYFYSVSDSFADLDGTDVNLTSAQVDTDVGAVMLPVISSNTTLLPPDQVELLGIDVLVDGSSATYQSLAPIGGALANSLDNVIWAFEVETDQPREVVATARFRLGNEDPVSLSQVEMTPYGATPVQVFMRNGDGDFGNKIQTGTTKMVFTETAKDTRLINITLRKTRYDYTENSSGTLKYKYLFGAKDLSFLHQVYERNAVHVSHPLTLPVELDTELVIDGVSLDVQADVPNDTDVNFFVAASQGGESTVDELVWRRIIPVSSNEPGDKIIRFGGAGVYTQMIRENPSAGDLQLMPSVTSGPVIGRNPTPSIIQGVDVYRLAELEESPILNSIELLEGVNTTRIYSKNIDNTRPFREVDLDYWSTLFVEADDLTLDYGRIDTGNEFFYGGDVGASGKEVFVETYLNADKNYETFLSEFQKVDIRSQTWDVKVYLNGRPLGHLPVGTHRMQLPWNFREGLNHIVILARIPLVAGESNPFMGALGLLSGSPIWNYGTVQLDKWSYVDLFAMKFNESGQPRTFTIHNNEIISRRKPTTNFQLRYALSTGQGPGAVRLRTELSRSRNNPNVTPRLEGYRLRFSYAGDA